MRLALDTSVLLTIFQEEPGSEDWMEALIQARRQGRLVLCEVVFAELAPAFSTRADLERVLDDLGARLDPIGTEAAWLAGKTFKKYRQKGGPRQYLIPDFLIAAHAQVQAEGLAARDRGYLRQYFPDLTLLRPRRNLPSPLVRSSPGPPDDPGRH